ncbi:MAG: hypothetical protein ACFFDT_37645 [Candidatus Hodarchaeota archaeon]
MKLEIEVPEYLIKVLDWYVEFTRYWVSNDYTDTARNALISEALRSYLESETDARALND